jgi:hypothetical protein
MMAPLLGNSDRLWVMVESSGLTEAFVLDVVNKLHADNPGKVTFGLAEIAEAVAPDQIAAVKAGSDVVLIWMESLNNILKKLGQDGRLTVIADPVAAGVDCAVVFPALGLGGGPLFCKAAWRDENLAAPSGFCSASTSVNRFGPW